MTWSPASAALLVRLGGASFLALLLDYDGTLVEYAATPDLARPDAGVIALLNRLAARPRTEVHVVSGRTRETLEQWLGVLPITLHAEHGAWSRSAGNARWTGVPLPPPHWREPVRAIMRDLARRIPGSLLEEKAAGLAWHYRLADPGLAAPGRAELRRRLAGILAEGPLTVLEGVMVVEVRPAAVHKGRVVPAIVDRIPSGALVAAMGDDRTDEDLFAALPPGAVTIRIGEGPSAAGFRLPDARAARALLAALAAR